MKVKAVTLALFLICALVSVGQSADARLLQSITCSAGCSTCSSMTQCNVCKIGYYLSGNSCFTCHASCYKCSGASATACTSCTSATYLSGNQCKACSASCADCSAANNCFRCNNGYSLTNNVCVKVSTSTTSSKKEPLATGNIVGIVIGVVGFIGVIIFGIYCCKKRKRTEKTQEMKLPSSTPAPQPHPHDDSVRTNLYPGQQVQPVMPMQAFPNSQGFGQPMGGHQPYAQLPPQPAGYGQPPQQALAPNFIPVFDPNQKMAAQPIQDPNYPFHAQALPPGQ